MPEPEPEADADADWFYVPYFTFALYFGDQPWVQGGSTDLHWHLNCFTPMDKVCFRRGVLWRIWELEFGMKWRCGWNGDQNWRGGGEGYR